MILSGGNLHHDIFLLASIASGHDLI